MKNSEQKTSWKDTLSEEEKARLDKCLADFLKFLETAKLEAE